MLHPTDFKTFCRLCQGTSRLMGTFPTHNIERERKVEGILGFLYPCPHKAKFLLFSSTHNRSNKFRITKFPAAQACLYLKYTTIKCLTHVYFKYRLLMFYSTVSDSYLIVRNPIFTDNYGNTKEKINFSECINHFKSTRLAFLQYQKRRGQNVYK